MRQTLASSKPSRAGATRRVSPSRWATDSASGSPNSSAARAEASTTLTGIAVGADNDGRLAGRAQPQPADLSEDRGWSGGPFLPDCRLDDRHQLALERSVVPLRTFPQT